MSLRHTTYTNSKGQKVTRHTSSYKDIFGVRHTETFIETEEQIKAKRKKSMSQWITFLCVIPFLISVVLLIVFANIGKANFKLFLIIVAFAMPFILRIVYLVIKKKKASK